MQHPLALFYFFLLVSNVVFLPLWVLESWEQCQKVNSINRFDCHSRS